MQTGAWPSKFLDHINRKPEDNRLENLREADRSQNGANRKSVSEVTSKYLGVSWHKVSRKWYAKTKGCWLGAYDCEIEAAKAYDEAAFLFFGDFANLNFKPTEESR